MTVSIPAPLEYTSHFAKSQTAYGTPIALTNADACFLDTMTIEEGGTRAIARTATGIGGAAPPLQSDRHFVVTATGQWYAPSTAGSLATMLNHPFWKASPMTITEAAPSVTMSPKNSMVPGVDWFPMTVSGQTKAGIQRTATNVMMVPTKIDATGGSIIMVDFVGIGHYTDDSAAVLTAPTLAADLPIVATNGTIVDGIGDDADFGFTLETGLSVVPARKTGNTDGWGYPMLASTGPCVLTYPVLATVPYVAAVKAGASHNIVATFGVVEFTFPAAYLFSKDLGETDTAQTYAITAHCARTTAAPEWTVVMT